MEKDNNLARRIASNTAWLWIAEIVGLFFTTVSGIIIIRYLGDSRYGIFCFVGAFVSLFAIFTDIGISTLVINEVSKDHSFGKKYLDNLILLKFLLGITTAAIISIIIFLSGKPGEVKQLIYLSAVGLVVSTISGLLTSFFRAVEKMKYEALFRILSFILSFFVVIVVVLLKLSILNLVVLNLLITIFVTILIYIFFRYKFFPLKPTFDLSFLKTIIKKAFPLGISAIFISIYYYLDIVMLSFWKTDQVVGWYNADYRILLMILAFFGVYFQVILPVVSRLIASSPIIISRLLSLSAKIILLVTIPLAVGVNILANKILNLLFGSQFIPGALALQILIWTVVVIGISSVYGTSMIAAGERNLYMKGVGLGALVNVILNFSLIPRYSIIGASIATLVAEIVVFAFMYYYFTNKIIYVPFFQYLAKPVLCSIFMAFFLWFFGYLHVLIVIIIGIFIYLTTIILMRGVSREEIQLARSIIWKQKTKPNY